MEALPADVTTPEGRTVTLTRDDWLHVKFRHPEVGTEPAMLLAAVSHPDEIHRDARGGHHALKRVDQRYFLVVIYDFASGGRGLIRTAFIINEKRKKRRYKTP